MELLVKLVVLGLVVWVLWVGLQPRCAFVVRVLGGQPARAKGVVTAAFLERVREVCQQHGVQTGTVRGLIRGGRISLAFSRAIPPAGQQQLRNWWVHSGWHVQPRKRRQHLA